MRFGKLAGSLAALSILFSPIAADAGQLTINVSGVFDTVGTVPGTESNVLEGLLGTNYSASFTVGTDRSSYVYTQLSDTGERGWLFKPEYYTNSVSTNMGGYSNTGIVVVSIINDLNYDGSKGIVPAGIYDIISISGWLYDSKSGHIFGSDPGVAGRNIYQELDLIGTSNLLANADDLPFANLDLSQVLYGQYFLSSFWDGVQTGEIDQDPPLSYVNGNLVGPGMSVAAVQSVPEPASIALAGLGLAGLGWTRRRTGQKAV